MAKLSLTSDISNLKQRVKTYQEVLQNTEVYRDLWKSSFKEELISQLSEVIKSCKLTARVDLIEEMENLEAVVFNLGEIKSGLYKRVSDSIQRDLIKHNGSLIYQQLYNGKVLVLIQYPFIEGIGKPRSPHTISVYRPDSLKSSFVIRHLETFFNEIANWEDLVNDEPQKRIGFEMNFASPENQ